MPFPGNNFNAGCWFQLTFSPTPALSEKYCYSFMSPIPDTGYAYHFPVIFKLFPKILVLNY